MKIFGNVHTVEALLHVTDTLVRGQLYLRPPCLKPRFNSHTIFTFSRAYIPVSVRGHFQRLRLRLSL